MKRIAVFLVILCIALLSFQPVMASQQPQSVIDKAFLLYCQSQENLIPVFLELKEANTTELYAQSYPTEASNRYTEQLLQYQETFMNRLQRSGLSFQLQYHLTETINGMSLLVKGKDVGFLATFPQVAHVYDNRREWRIQRSIAAITTGANKVWTKSNQPATGKGVTVGVLDTGLDTTHVKSGEFVGRVLGGYDYADRDADFNDNSVGHGTHVAGIVGGKGKEEFYRGMAYEAKFRIYKVFPNQGRGAPSTALSKAIDQSVKDKCAVINMSLGSEGGMAQDNLFYGKIIHNAVKAGTMVVCSAGNSGSRGKSQQFPAGLPGNAEDAFSVGATNDRAEQILSFVTDTETKNINAMHSPQTIDITSATTKKGFVDCGYGKLDEYPSDDIEGKIALVQRGPNGSNMSFREKMDNAIKKNASAIFVYNYEIGGLIAAQILQGKEGIEEVTTIPLYFISQQDGHWIKARINQPLPFSIIGSPVTITQFSAMGPTEDGFFKPEISAPGDNILSTYKDGKYALMSGTSMSSPVVTGLVALIKQIYPKWTHDQIKSALMNTAEILINPVNGLPITFQLQGAGEARVDRAMVTPAFLKPRALVVQKNIIQPDDQNPSSWLTCELSSNQNNSQTFSLSYKTYLLEGEYNPIQIEFKQESVTVAGNKSVSFEYHFQIEWDKMERARYEGIIMIGSDLHIPFIIYRDGVSKIPDSISDIRVNPTEVNFIQSSDSAPADNGIHLYFTMNNGLEVKYSGFEGGTDYYNYNNVEAVLLDENGDDWVSIATFSGLMVGEYNYYWDGKLPNGKYFIPKGKYYIQFRMIGRDYNKNGEVFLSFGKGDEGKVTFQVGQSDVPDPLEMIISSKKMVTIDDLFTVECVLPTANNLIGLEFALQYDPGKLSIRDYEFIGFFDEDGTEVDTSFDEDDSAGILTVFIKRDSDIGISGTNKRFLRITFKAIDKGKVKWGARNSKVWFDSSDTASRMRVQYPDLRVQRENNYLIADFNDDDIVNQYDWLIFMEAYPSVNGDENFDEQVDLNQDRRIDFLDFMIFTKEYGKAI